MSDNATNLSSMSSMFRLAWEASPTGCLVVDGEGRIVLVNRALEALFGYAADELVGHPIEVLVPMSARPGHKADRDGYLAAPTARPMGAGRDLVGRRKDGAEVPVEVGLNPMRLDDGTLWVLGSVVDITARKTLEGRLRHAEKMDAVGALAGGIAHDFNNVLLAILGYAELLEASAAVDDTARADLVRITAAAARGQDLVQRILRFSRAEERPLGESAREPTSLVTAVADALGMTRAALPANIEIREFLDSATPATRCGMTEIHQIVTNLAVNGARAMGARGGILEISAAPYATDEAFERAHPEASPGLYARLTVVDHGAGMSPEVARRVFEPFYTTERAGRGTGLGLWIIHSIVADRAGVVEIHSQPGEGTRVEIFLPAATRSAARVADEVPAGAAATPEGPHILLVEDESPLLELARRRLQGCGYRLTARLSSLEALRDYRATPDAFDLVITDNNMPHLTGAALAAEVLKIRPTARILMVSGLADTLSPADIAALGVTAVLSKPHTRQQLLDAVGSALPSGS